MTNQKPLFRQLTNHMSQEVLRLDTESRTFSQEIVSSSQAVMVCKAAPVKVTISLSS